MKMYRVSHLLSMSSFKTHSVDMFMRVHNGFRLWFRHGMIQYSVIQHNINGKDIHSNTVVHIHSKISSAKN